MDDALDAHEQAELDRLTLLDPELAAYRQLMLGLRPETEGPVTSEERKESILDDVLGTSHAAEHTLLAPRARRRRLWVAAAALVAGALALGAFYFRSGAAKTEKWVVVKTDAGKRARITLPDGTEVILNAGSRLSYPGSFSDGMREIRLAGEAYFDVTPNAHEPFVIHTPEMKVTVLGTQFNLKAYPEDRITETALISGAVEVTLLREGGRKVRLKPMQKISVEKTPELPEGAPITSTEKEKKKPAIVVSAVVPASGETIETAWTADRLMFRDERFDDLALRIGRQYGKTFVFSKESLKSLSFSGTLKSGDSLEQLLHILQQIQPFEYSITERTVVIL